MAEDRLQYYTQAMEIDATSDKPMPKVAIVVPGDSGTGGALPVTIQGASESGGALKVILDSTNFILPVDIQVRLPKTIQTHSGVVVPPTTGTSASAWIDTEGFDKVAITFVNDAATNAYIDIQWSNDGVNMQGDESPVPFSASTDRWRSGIVETKAKWMKLVLNNTDAAAHTMNTWAYLKA